MRFLSRIPLRVSCAQLAVVTRQLMLRVITGSMGTAVSRIIRPASGPVQAAGPGQRETATCTRTYRECRIHEMRTRGMPVPRAPGREGRHPRGASAPASSDPSGSAAMRPAAAAPDDPEEVQPLPEPSTPSRRASRAWDRPVNAPSPPPGARPPARNAAVGADEERNPFEE